MPFPLPPLSRDAFAAELAKHSPEPLSTRAVDALHAHYQELSLWNQRLSLIGPGTAGVLVERGRGGAQRGWVCVGAGQLAAAPAVRFEQEGRTATFVTLLVPRPDGAGEVATAVLRGRPFVDEASVSVTVRGIGDELLIPAEGPVTIRTGLPVGDAPGPPGGERP